MYPDAKIVHILSGMSEATPTDSSWSEDIFTTIFLENPPRNHRERCLWWMGMVVVWERGIGILFHLRTVILPPPQWRQHQRIPLDRRYFYHQFFWKSAKNSPRRMPLMDGGGGGVVALARGKPRGTTIHTIVVANIRSLAHLWFSFFGTPSHSRGGSLKVICQKY